MGAAVLDLSRFHSSLAAIRLSNICRSPFATAHFQAFSTRANRLHAALQLHCFLPACKQQAHRIVAYTVIHERVTHAPCEANHTLEERGVAEGVSSSLSSTLESENAVAVADETERNKKQFRRKAERYTYLSAAVASSLGVTFLAGAAVYYRFVWQMQGGEVPYEEVFGTFSLAIGAAVGMEIWARWAHRVLWHASLWRMHESHHRPRDGPFELNDVFAIINAVPAIALMAYGFLHKGLLPGLCFGAGLGITVFGIAYMFVHDGLVHRRFPVGPIANVPYFQKVAAAHQIHHADKFNGVPYGLFLGPKELEEVGGAEELDKLINKRRTVNEKGRAIE